MPDNNAAESNKSTADDLDFTGLIPGEDVPRRRRRPSRANREDEQMRGEHHGEEVTEQETDHGHSTQTRHDIASPQDPAVEVESQSEPTPAPGNVDTSDNTLDPEEGASGAPAREEVAADRTENRLGGIGERGKDSPESRVSSPTVRGETEPVAPSSAETHSAGTVEDAATQAMYRATPEAATGQAGATGRIAREGQALLLEGEDLDRILRNIASVPSEQRHSYKSTITLSEDYYELLTDLRKDLRRRGFSGNDATMSNLFALGLDIIRQTLDAERHLPGS